MPQSLANVLIHVIFSTKNRYPFIDPDIENELYPYLTACRTCHCPAHKIGGTADHIHIACSLARTVSIAKLLEEIKSDSSRWIKSKGRGIRGSRGRTDTARFQSANRNWKASKFTSGIRGSIIACGRSRKSFAISSRSTGCNSTSVTSGIEAGARPPIAPGGSPRRGALGQPRAKPWGNEGRRHS